MKQTKIIATASLTLALSIIFLLFFVLIGVTQISTLPFASVIMMIPLAKGSVKCAFFAYGATSLLSLIFTMGVGKFSITALYVVFFGLHPIINYLATSKKWNKILLFIIKDVWFILTLLLMYFAFTLFTDMPEFFEKYAIFIIILGGAILFVPYDFALKRFQKLTNQIITRIKL